MEIVSPLTVVLADEHGVIREGIASYLKSRTGVSIVAQCSDGSDAIRLILSHRPDVAIFDVNSPGADGLEIVTRVRAAGCTTRLIALSVIKDATYIHTLFDHGIDAYVLKDSPAEHLFDAITVSLGGGQYLTPALGSASGRRQPNRDPRALLSRREYEVFCLLAGGARPRDIASDLGISAKTVDTYRANILRKLEVASLAEIVRLGIAGGLGPVVP